MLANETISGWYPHSPFVVDIHTSLAFTRSLHHRAIGVHERFLKELGALLLPNVESRFIEHVHQAFDFRPCEATAEVTGSCRVRDPRRSQGIQVHLIVAAELQVFQAPSHLLTSCKQYSAHGPTLRTASRS